MQGSDVLATPDVMALIVVWKDTNRPGPFPAPFVSNSACLPTGFAYTNLLLFLGSHSGN
jgi:hypothetical protein